MQFYIPSHHFDDSYAIGVEKSPELVVPSSTLIKPEEDGSLGVILKEGLYVWKALKRFTTKDDAGDLWITQFRCRGGPGGKPSVPKPGG